MSPSRLTASPLRRLSDTLCVENGLSVIENPATGQGKHYGEWLGDGKRLSHQDELRAAIDSALAKSPASFEDFISLMRDAGYIVNTNRKHITFLLPEWKQPTRMDTLKGDHTEAAVRERIGSPVVFSSAGKESTAPTAVRKPGLLIDIESKLRQGKGEGYAHCARLFNLKQMAQTMLYLQEHGFDNYEDLRE